MGAKPASTLAKQATGMAVKHLKRQLLIWLAPYLAVGALVIALVIGAVLLLSSTSNAPAAQAEEVTVTEAAKFGINQPDLVAIRAAANASRVPWQVLASLAAAESGQTPTALDSGASVLPAGASSGAPIPVSPGASPPAVSPPAGSAPAGSTPAGSVAGSITLAGHPRGGSPGAGDPGGPYRINPGSGLGQTESRDLYLSSVFLAERLAKNLDGKPGFIGVNSLTNNAVVNKDGLYLDPTSPDYKAREDSFVKALVKLPVANNNDPYMTQVYETAQAWALGRPGSQCGSGGLSVTGIAGGGIAGGGLTTAVPEPMRSQIIVASQAAGVPPAAVASLYLTEQNGFQFIYHYYDNGKNVSAFQLTPDSPAWHLAIYGVSGQWPAGGKFRGAFQFGPIWESTYQTPAHPDVLKFADAVYGAAKYMADLGAKGGDLESVRKAAQSYNGQTSFSIGGGIRNPDPAKYTVVRQLYADQVVFLTQALSDGTGATATSPSGSGAAPSSAVGPSPAPSPSAAASPVPVSGSVQPSASAGAGAAPGGAGAVGAPCGAAGALAGSAAGPGGVTVLVNGVNVTIPANPQVPAELQGKVVIAPNAQVAAGIAWAIQQLGTPYVYGGGGLGSAKAPPNVPAGQSGPDDGCARASCLGLVGFDCSGLSWSTYDHMQPALDLQVGYSGAMAQGGFHLPLSQSVAGDLITYGGSATHHVAVSLGWIGGKLIVIEAPDTGLFVRIKASSSSDINNWASRYWAGGAS